MEVTSMRDLADTGKEHQGKRISVAWPAFGETLGAVLSLMEEGQFLILTVKKSQLFVQFAAQGSFGMRVETARGDYLDGEVAERAHYEEGLVALGWKRPSGTQEESTSRGDPDGSPNFYHDVEAPVVAGDVAAFVIRTLIEVTQVSHPGHLEYVAFDEYGAALELPHLGLRREDRSRNPNTRDGVLKALLAAASEVTGISDLEFDSDGDLGVECNGGVTYISLLGNPPRICLHSPLVVGVEPCEHVFELMNELNAVDAQVRFLYRDSLIFASAQCYAVPFVKAHFQLLFEHFCKAVDGLNVALQEKLGGRTLYSGSDPDATRH